MWVQFDLGGRFNVGMLRLWNQGQHHGSYAMDIRVETSVDGRVWHEAIKRSPLAHFYWSGPRVYPWEWGYRWEARFTPIEARLIRITQYEDGTPFPWMIAEAYIYEDLGVRARAQTGEEDVIRRIRELGLHRVYADRWMTAKISEASHGRIETVTPFTIATESFHVRLKSRVIQWNAKVGFVLEDSDADEFERLMKEEDVHHLTREGAGRWVLFYFKAPAASLDARQDDPGWWWNGVGAVRTEPKDKSRYLAALAQQAFTEEGFGRALELSRKAVDAYRFNRQGRQVLIQALDKLGRKAEAFEQSKALSDLSEPRVKTSVEFRKTLEFLGYTLSHEPAKPGEELGIRYFWKVKRDPGRKERIGVFVHIQNGDGRFQGDFRFLDRHEWTIWPALEAEIFIQDERIRIPADAAPGTYRIVLGVYDLETGKRWKVSASENTARRDRAPVGVLHVEPSESR